MKEWGMRGDGAIYEFVWRSLVCPTLAWRFVYLFIFVLKDFS